ncbi:MAG: glycosyltransferase [Candidatus Sungbacteria bacterium]|nr:glycosyltransferase [Candidatus Sungbacteria bacterium]
MTKGAKYIFVCGGVMSGIGKGITAASIGRILKDYGFAVSMMKIDPYFNVDAGTLNPIVHGEVFVTNDGTEADQDLGNYERFLDVDMTRNNIMTSGLVYRTVIEKERNLEYAGKDVQMMSDIPDEVIRRMQALTDAEHPDFVLVEVGGTAGDNENLVFLEAAAAGLPVIGTTGNGITDAIAHGRNGFLVPQGDVGATAEAVRQILSDRILWERMSDESRTWAGEHNLPQSVQQYLDIYRAVMSYSS